MLTALIKKEFLQIIRDPSSIIIAFVLPLICILIYMYGINLDTPSVTMGIKSDDTSSEIHSLIKSFGNSKYIKAVVYDNKEDITRDIARSKIKGAAFIPQDFCLNLSKGKIANALIVTDGSEVNTANYVYAYSMQIINGWLSSSKYATNLRTVNKSLINVQLRTWYNQDLNSHYFILPGSLAITMTLIGILLTALVIAREWERGTMEALLSTKIKKIHILLSKYIPYFILGMLSMAFNVFLCVYIFSIPFRGNIFVLFFVSGLFLFTCLGIGLLISTITKSLFLASMISVAAGFLPALLLSGLMFPISSMPKIFQYLTMILPPRYFITFIESEFMAGTVWNIVLINSVYLSILGLILFIVVYKKTSLRLEN